MSCRLGVDVGDTFTDVLLVDERAGSTWRARSGIDTAVIAGVSTSGCVRASAADAMQHGFRPIVVAEACGDRTPAIHAANIADLQAKYADIATIEEVIARFAKS
jgi:maleamate amidohydrolase